MPSSRRLAKSRRSFLKSFPTAVVAGAVATQSAPLPAQSSPPLDAISADALGVAQQLIAIDLPVAERESARPLVTRNRDHYEAIDTD